MNGGLFPSEGFFLQGPLSTLDPNQEVLFRA